MKITVERSVKDRLDGFFAWLKNAAQSDDHEQHKDLIADFVDKVLVFELKRQANDTGTYTEEIEIPKSVLIDPLIRMKKALDKHSSEAFDDYLKKLGHTGTVSAPAPVQTPPAPVQTPPAPTQTAPAPQTVPSTGISVAGRPSGPRNGNGHKSEKTRDLHDRERDGMRNWFISKNGQIADDDCVEFKNGMAADVAIFQVTGFISYLHRDVACGRTQLSDLAAYEKWMHDKYGKLWAQYNDPKYVQSRQQNQAAIAAGNKPIFTPFPKKR